MRRTIPNSQRTGGTFDNRQRRHEDIEATLTWRCHSSPLSGSLPLTSRLEPKSTKDRALFNHVQIKVNDFGTSRPFYEVVLGVLGYRVVLESEGVAVGIGTTLNNMLEISQADASSPVSRSVHIAFIAESVGAVEAFHATALALGAKDNGKPGLRPQYEDGYFAAFVIDPNGHNLEAVFNDPGLSRQPSAGAGATS